MSAAAARAVLRPSRLTLRQTPVRNASTTSEAANAASKQATKAKEGASEAANAASKQATKAKEGAYEAAGTAQQQASNASSKASEGLSKVTTSADSAMNKAGPAITQSLSKVGGRTGRMISFVQCASRSHLAAFARRSVEHY